MTDPPGKPQSTIDDGDSTPGPHPIEYNEIAPSGGPTLRDIVQRSRESYRQQGGISAAEMRRQVQQWKAEELSAEMPAPVRDE
ncbi:MAG: hypothetical protein KY476_09000 [Planctomycetes bacterium]|nr:hypothetical protein [Planctomycetota bacterium]